MQNTNNIETLDMNEPATNSDSSSFKPVNKVIDTPLNPPPPTDIPKTYFKPIEQVQDQRNDLLYQYHLEQGNIAIPNVPDLTNEVKELEKKLQKKKLNMPPGVVLVLVVVINLVWFLGVRFLIVPKYEEYVKQSEEIKETYDDLKRKVDALVGE